MEKQTLTVPETAQVLGIGRNSAYAAVRTGTIPSLKIGRRVLVPRRAVEKMLGSSGTDAPSSRLTSREGR